VPSFHAPQSSEQPRTTLIKVELYLADDDCFRAEEVQLVALAHVAIIGLSF